MAVYYPLSITRGFVITLILLVPLISGTPLWQRSATTVCGQYDTVTAGRYALLTNLWGTSGTTSGWQCSTLNSVKDNTVAWSTEWTWSGENSIKSFSNIQLNTGVNQQLGTISSMPATWHWSQTGTGTVVANVAFDLFISSNIGSSNGVEIMIWLANVNAGPISTLYTASDNSQADPVKSALSISGHTWDLYLGSNDAWPVYSFLPTNGGITSFSADIYPFISYLVKHYGIDSSHYLTIAQAGTEATCGTVTLTTSAYSLTIN
ncbi:glycoside hydrolase family 12 protein [Melanogaster broomeanus]|nr:glycoside hydrolase family 12 protein [Melanogaster broomeanus]